MQYKELREKIFLGNLLFKKVGAVPCGCNTK